jgi:hypothetical protein
VSDRVERRKKVMHRNNSLQVFRNKYLGKQNRNNQSQRIKFHLTCTMNIGRVLTGRNGRPIGLKMQVGEGVALSFG